MTERNIAIGIDSTKAASGGRVVKRQLDDIGNSAVKAEDNIKKLGSSANDNLKQVSQSALGANTSLARLQATFSALGGSLRATMMIFASFATILAGLALSSVIDNFIRMADAFKNMTSQLKLVTAGATQLADVQDKLFRSAQSTRSSFEATAGLYAKLARAASELGLSQDQLLTITENVNKAFVISGADANEAAGAIRQLAQGLASGALRGDEFNTIAEAAPRLLQAVAEHLKMGVGQLRAYAAEGKITAKVLSEALLAATQKLNTEFSLMGTTVGQAMVVLGNSIFYAVGKMDTALGITDKIAAAIIAVANGIDNLGTNLAAVSPYLAIIGTGMAVAFGPSVVATVVTLTALIAGGLVNAIAAASTAMVAFSLSNPFTALLLAITSAVAAVYYFRDEINKAIGTDVVEVIQDSANIIIGSFVAAWEDIKAVWGMLPDLFGAAFVGAVNVAIEQINRLTGAFTGAMDIIISGLNALGSDIKPFGDSGQIDTVFNTYLISLELAIQKRNQMVSEALSTDWLGKITQIFTGSEPGKAPVAPGVTTATPANDNVPAELQKIIAATNDKVRALQSESEALKLTGYAASVYREQQELINAALEKGISLTPQQTANLKALGEQMAALKSQNSASSMLQDQQSTIGRLQLERQLIGSTTAEREKALAVYDAEQQMIQKGINLNTQQAAAIRANAAATAQLKLENERISAAYTEVQNSAATAIDTLVQGAVTVGNNWKDTFKNILQGFLNTFTQLAVANPLKNMLLGTNLPTITDLFNGGTSATPGTTTTGTMTVSAATVLVNGAIPGIPGLTPGATNTTLGQFLGATPTNGVRPSLTPAGIVNSPVSAASNPAIAGLLNDPSLASRVSSVGGMPTGLSPNEALTWNHFASQGMQPHQISAVMGNLKAESAFNPAAVGDGGNAFGLAQWNDRGPAMKAFVGSDWASDPKGQLNFMSHEFATTENPAYQRLMASQNVEQANAAMMSFERPSGFSLTNPQNGHNYSGRLSASQDYMNRASSSSLPGTEEASSALSKLATNSAKASTDISGLSTGADTAAKALSTSSQSVSSSVGTLATTTAEIPAQTGNLFSTMTSSIGSGFSSLFSGIGSLFSGLFANGDAFSGGRVIPFASGGVVSGPTPFPMRGGAMGLMGEAGAEAIMPLRRGPDGKLGVSMHGGVSSGSRQQQVTQNIRMETTIKVEGVGDKDLMQKIEKGVDEKVNHGFKQFSRDQLPGRVREIQSDKWARG